MMGSANCSQTLHILMHASQSERSSRIDPSETMSYQMNFICTYLLGSFLDSVGHLFCTLFNSEEGRYNIWNQMNVCLVQVLLTFEAFQETVIVRAFESFVESGRNVRNK